MRGERLLKTGIWNLESGDNMDWTGTWIDRMMMEAIKFNLYTYIPYLMILVQQSMSTKRSDLY